MLREEPSGFDGAEYLSFKNCGRSDRRAVVVTRIVSSRRGTRASVATVALAGGTVSVGIASSIQWEQPVPIPSVMASTLPINGREKIWPIISSPPDLEKE
jgi:hypothetical protein